MKARVLDASEWGLLEDKPLGPLMPNLRPMDTRIVVVEDDGEIVAHLGVLKVTHLEGLWIAPKYRGNVAVGRGLLEGAMRQVRPWSTDWVMALAADDVMSGLVTRLGGVRLPVESYVMHFGGD